MCGRSRSALAPEDVVKSTKVREERWKDRDKYRQTYNLSPGRWGVVLKRNYDDHRPELQTMKWGLVPSYTKPSDKPDHYKMFNARSETVDTKPVFKRLLSRKRCVVVFEGFYEWQKKDGGKKQPFYLYLKDRPLMLAGLYDSYVDSEGNHQHSFTVLTVDSSKKLQWLHDRMPAILADDAAVQAWLSADDVTDPSKLVNQLCAPYDGEDLMWHPVTPAMGKPSFDGPQCSEDVRQAKGGIASFFKPAGGKAAGKATSIQKEEEKPAGKSDECAGGGRAAAEKAAVKKEEGQPAGAARNTDECADVGKVKEEEEAKGGAGGAGGGGVKRDAEAAGVGVGVEEHAGAGAGGGGGGGGGSAQRKHRKHA